MGYFDVDEEKLRVCLRSMKNLRNFGGYLPPSQNRFELKFQRKVLEFILILQREFPQVAFVVKNNDPYDIFSGTESSDNSGPGEVFEDSDV